MMKLEVEFSCNDPLVTPGLIAAVMEMAGHPCTVRQVVPGSSLPVQESWHVCKKFTYKEMVDIYQKADGPLDAQGFVNHLITAHAQQSQPKPAQEPNNGIPMSSKPAPEKVRVDLGMTKKALSQLMKKSGMDDYIVVMQHEIDELERKVNGD